MLFRSIRKAHLKENNTCAVCGRIKGLEVHHIKPVHLFPDLELDPNNLITLCADTCHLAFGHLFNFKSWNKDVENDAKKFNYKVKYRP